MAVEKTEVLPNLRLSEGRKRETERFGRPRHRVRLRKKGFFGYDNLASGYGSSSEDTVAFVRDGDDLERRVGGKA